MIHQDRFFKLEMLILSLLHQRNYTCEQLWHIFQNQANEVINIKQGIILASLYYLKEAHLISAIQGQVTYYHIEKAGIIRLETLKRRYKVAQNSIETILAMQGDTYE